MNTGHHIPVEVLERVIDWIDDWRYGDDTQEREQYGTWKACALTCRAVRPRSQNWLFRRIVLDSARQAENLKPILRGNDSMAKKVRVLMLVADGGNSRRNTWLYWIPLVFGPLLVNLEELCLYHVRFEGGHPRFLSSLAVFKSIILLQLYQVSFARFGHCTQLIRAFPHLGHLELYEVSWESDPTHFQLLHGASLQCPTRRPVQIPHLDLLKVDANRICKWLSGVDAGQHLRTFFGKRKTFLILMDHQPPGGYDLESIYLASSHDRSITISSNSLNSLQTMHIHVWEGIFPTELLNCILSYTPRALREVTVYLRIVEDDDELMIPEEKETAAAYTELDSVLRNSSLKEVKMTVCLYDKGASLEAKDRLQQWLVKMLPKFCSNEDQLTVIWNSNLEYPHLRWREHRDGF